MRAYGWTESQIYEAVRLANARLGPDGVPRIEVRHLEVLTRRCRRGGHTLQFKLGFYGPTHRRRDGTYAPGLAWTWQSGSRSVRDVVPLAELTEEPGEYNRWSGTRTVHVDFKRSTGSLCWHTFGWVMREMFEMNPDGKIRAAREYDGKLGFECNARCPTQGLARQECECWEHGLTSFLR